MLVLTGFSYQIHLLGSKSATFLKLCMQFILVFYFKILMLPFSFFRPICTIKRKNFNIFSSYSKIRKKKNAMILFNLFFLGLYPHFIIFQRSGVEAREFRNIANNLLLRLMIVVEDTVKELGITKEELREVQRKRSYITACYFQAVTCY